MYLLAACMGAAVLIGVWQYMGREDGRQMDKNSIRIGVLLYRGDDTFIGTLRSGLEDKAKEYEQETGIKVKLDIMDAKGSQNTQNSQVERLISLGCDALCINSVDRSSASIIIDKAMDAGTPVVFFNREPVEEDMNRWEKLYYVGADAKESAVLQGDILVDAYNQDTRTLDANCLKEPRCNNSLANGSSVTRLSIRDSSFSSTLSYKETNPLTISKVCNPSGIIVIKISGISVLSFIGRPLFNSCINNSVPLTD